MSGQAGGWLEEGQKGPRDQVTMISLHHGRNYTCEIYCDPSGDRLVVLGGGSADEAQDKHKHCKISIIFVEIQI